MVDVDQRLPGDYALCVGARLFDLRNIFRGVVYHRRFDDDGEPVYYTDGGDTKRHERFFQYNIACGTICVGRREHPRKSRTKL